jgi:Flagellar biosynthesis protein, FliO
MWSATVERVPGAGTGKGGSVWTPLLDGIRVALRKVRVQKKPRSLRVQETVPLGERRFLAVVQWGNEQLLVGVTAQGIALLKSREQPADSGFAWEEGKEG